MSVNKYLPHVIVIPEDDANRQLANGFLLHQSLKNGFIDVRPPAGGWKAVFECFQRDYIKTLRSRTCRHLILLIDFDDDFENRKKYFESHCPEEIRERVYLIGCRSEPEFLRKNCRKSFEKIGTTLAESCSRQEEGLWNHSALAHNQAELERLRKTARPILFS